MGHAGISMTCGSEVWTSATRQLRNTRAVGDLESDREEFRFGQNGIFQDPNCRFGVCFLARCLSYFKG